MTCQLLSLGVPGTRSPGPRDPRSPRCSRRDPPWPGADPWRMVVGVRCIAGLWTYINIYIYMYNIYTCIYIYTPMYMSMYMSMYTYKYIYKQGPPHPPQPDGSPPVAGEGGFSQQPSRLLLVNIHRNHGVCSLYSAYSAYVSIIRMDILYVI